MEYQLSFIDVFKSLFFPADYFFVLTFLGAPIFVAVVIYHSIKNRTAQLAIIVAGIVIPSLITFFALLPVNGSGWKFEEDELAVKAWPIKDSIKLSSVKTMINNVPGNWEPSRRTRGYGTPGLGTGWFKLRNGKEAVVFKHGFSTKVVVIYTNDRYYVFSHPGVEKLYNELIKRGAKMNEI